MSNDLNEKKYPKLALPIGRIKVPKFLYFILIVLGIAIFILVSFKIASNIKSKSASNVKVINVTKNIVGVSVGKVGVGGVIGDGSSTTDSNSVKLINLEIAQKTLDWIDKQRNNDGIYSVGVVCKEKLNQCQSLGESHYSGILVIWGRFNYFLKNKDQKELDLVKNDIDNYFELVKTKTIGTNTEGCRFLYDLWKDKNINDDYKNKIAAICSKFERPDFLNYEDIKKTDIELLVSIDQKIDQILKWKAGEKINTSEEYKLIIQQPDFSLDPYPNFMSDYLVQSKMSDNDFLITQANKIFDVLLEDLSSKLNTPINNNGYLCRVGKSALDFYLINNNSKSLELAKKIAQIGFQDKFNINCALLASRLEILDRSNSIYSNYKNSFLMTNYNNNFSELGFWRKEEDKSRVEVGFNGLMVGLLSQ